MSKKLVFFMVTFLIIGSFCFSFNRFVKAETYGLSISYVFYPLSVYVGNSFVVQIRISNNDTMNHAYKVEWLIDGGVWPETWFFSIGVVGPNETISLTPSFTFSNPGTHQISVALYQDEILIDQRLPFRITAEKLDFSLEYAFDTYPIYPDSTFSLTLEVANMGSQTMYDTTVTVFPLRPEIGIYAQYGLITDLNNITSKSHSFTTVPFNVSKDASPGIYSLEVGLEFTDFQGYIHEKKYYFPIQLSSAETRDKVILLEPRFGFLEGEINKLRNAMLLNINYITLALFAVNMATAGLNYWYARRAARRARARAKILRK